MCSVLLLLRLISLPLYPLIDRSESRYCEIGRGMSVHADWVTPRIAGRPFWGKPPLSMWCTAAGVEVFGRSEFAVRFPAFLAGLLTVLLVWRLGATLGGPSVGRLSAIVFCCAPMTLYLTGGVMTDPYLVLGTTLAWCGILGWAARESNATARRSTARTAVVTAAGLAVATLAKGPVGLVIGLSPLFALCLLGTGRRWLRGWPWIATAGVWAVLTVPWFVAAELRTPGFLEYFLVGEHFQRFVDADWPGDLYGGTHPSPPGVIWLFLLVAMFPWIPVGLWALWRGRGGLVLASLARRPRRTALAAAFLTPLVLFTPASSVLITYVYPSLPAASVLLALAIHRLADRDRFVRGEARRMPWVVLAVALIIVGALPFVPSSVWAYTSQRAIVEAADHPYLIYTRDIEFLYSAHFYSDGRAVAASGPDDPLWARARLEPERTMIVTRKRRMQRIPADVRERLRLERDFDGRYQVWTVSPASAEDDATDADRASAPAPR